MGQIGGGVLLKNRYLFKTKNISMLASYKKRCPLHKFRYELANYLKDKETVDTYGSFDGGRYVDLEEVLDDYRYSIVIENEQSPYYFTEKIINCFAAMVVPIYIGASKIGDFFDKGGIIQIDATIEAVTAVISQCNEQDYMRRKEAIINNFNLIQEHLCAEDYIYMHYKRELFE